MLLRTIGDGKWFTGLEQMHRFCMNAVLVESKPIYANNNQAFDFNNLRIEDIDGVWVYVLMKENNKILKIIAHLDATHAFESQDRLFQFLRTHKELWLFTEPLEIPEEWISNDSAESPRESLLLEQPLLAPCPALRRL